MVSDLDDAPDHGAERREAGTDPAPNPAPGAITAQALGVSGGPMISAPKSSLTRLSRATSGGSAGGRPRYSAARPAATKYCSNPPGVHMERNRAGESPSTTNVWAT